MKLRHSKISTYVVAAVVVATMAALAGGVLEASNMGFKMNKVVFLFSGAGSAPKGDNFVSLPFRHPYQNAADICSALALTNGTGTVQLVDAATGTPFNFTCGGGGPFSLTAADKVRIGLRVRNLTATGGNLVGSHAAGPPGVTFFRFFGAGSAPRGDNQFPVLYHGTAATAQDVCSQAGLGAGSTIQRIDASTGTPSNHTCGGGAPFSLVLGESVRVREPNAQINGFVPPHF
jgi:hypothetical protein